MTYSVRQLASCKRLGRAAGNEPSTADESLRALVGGDEPRSVLAAIRAVTQPMLDLNLLWVNPILAANFAGHVDSALDEMCRLLGAAGLSIGRVTESTLPIEAIEFTFLQFHNDADPLTQRFTGPGPGLDIFLVGGIRGDAVGLSPAGGTCSKDSASETTGVVIALEGDETLTAFSMAHEACHYLGLDHVPGKENLMFEKVPNGGRLSASEVATIAKHCIIRPNCTWPL